MTKRYVLDFTINSYMWVWVRHPCLLSHYIYFLLSYNQLNKNETNTLPPKLKELEQSWNQPMMLMWLWRLTLERPPTLSCIRRLKCYPLRLLLRVKPMTEDTYNTTYLRKSLNSQQSISHQSCLLAAVLMASFGNLLLTFLYYLFPSFKGCMIFVFWLLSWILLTHWYFFLLIFNSSAMNSETDEKVAIKKIANAFGNKVAAKRTLCEIKLLRHFEHENVRIWFHHYSFSEYQWTDYCDCFWHLFSFSNLFQ